MAFDPLHFRFTQAAIGSPEEVAGTAAEAAAGAASPLSQVALQKGILIALDEILTVVAETGVEVTPDFVDDAAFTPGTSRVMPIGGTYRASRDALDSGDAGALALNERRGVYVTLEAADSTPLALAAGAVSAATLRVISASDDPAVTALQIIDDWDESDRAKVNPIVGQAGVAAGAGAVGVTVQRVTLASDDPGVVALQVIDDWDESDRAKVNLIVGQAGIAAGAGAVGATVPRVTLASDDPAVASLSVLDDWDETDRAKVNIIVGQAGVAAGAGAVGATVPRVTLASDDPVTTAVQIMDDWDESDRAKVNPIVGQAGVAAGAGSVGTTVQRMTLASDDPLVAKTASLGSVSTASLTSLASSASSAQLLASTAGRKGLILVNTDANAVLVKYGTTASSSSFTVRIPQYGYWEMPQPIYTGRIDAIWEADGSGSVFATEMT